MREGRREETGAFYTGKQAIKDHLQKQWFPSWRVTLEHHKEAENGSPVGQSSDLSLTPLAGYALSALFCFVF